jgi:cell division protein FtsL
MAPRRVAGRAAVGRSAASGGRRRSLIALVLVGFVLVTAGVILRRVYGVQQQQRIRLLEQRRDALEAERIHLEGAIRDASSRSRLQPIAEQQLHMHIATPDEQVFLPRPTPRSGTAPHDSV